MLSNIEAPGRDASGQVALVGLTSGVTEASLREVRASSPSVPPELCRRFVAAQLAGDRAGALSVVDEALASGAPVTAIQLGLIQAAQYEVGRLWETNAINIAVEHQATAIAQLALAALYTKMPRRPRNGKRVTIACVEGELHDMGARISADFLEMEGYGVHMLGANVPPRSLAECVEQFRPHLVALSATMTFHLPALVAAIRAVRATSLRAVPVVVGGHAFTWSPGVELTLDIQGSGGDAFALILEANRLLVGVAA